MDWFDSEFLDKETNLTKTLVSESTHINRQNSSFMKLSLMSNSFFCDAQCKKCF